MKSVCVFCGSIPGLNPAFAAAARLAGATIASRNSRLVYGGGHVGLMGIVADAALAAGGEVLGIIPRDLDDREIGHRGLTELRVTASMHERKAMMVQESDGFMALPGGFGTLDELCEILTWATLGIHHKPIGLVNVDGFFNALTGFFDNATAAGFIREGHRAVLLEDDDVNRLLERMATWQPTATNKWAEPVPAPAP